MASDGKTMFVVDEAAGAPDNLWELSLKWAKQLEESGAMSKPSPEFYRTHHVKVLGTWDPVRNETPVTIEWPDGTTTETTLEAMFRAGMTITLDDMQPAEQPTQQVTISVSDEPPADEPHVVEGS